MIEDYGVYWYCGYTQVSKTRSAVADAYAARDRKRRPFVAIDSGGVWNFSAFEHSPDVATLARRAWRDRATVAFMPEAEDVKSVNQIYGLARRLRNAIILLDEASFWIDSDKIPPNIRLILRLWFHAKALLIFTTQRIQDVNPKAMAVHKEIRIFRTVETAAHDRMWERWKIKPEEVLYLADEKYVTIREGVACRNPDGSLVVSCSL